MKSYGSPGLNEGGESLVVAPDGNIYLGGYRGDSALVMKLNPAGDVLWSRTFLIDVGHINYVNQMAVTPDGYLIGCGGSNTSVGGARTAFYFKLDQAGNAQWIMRSDDARPVYARVILPKSSQEYTLFGCIYDMGSPTFADPIQIGVDAATGTMAWTGPRYDYVSSEPYIDDVTGADVAPTGYSLSTGRIYANSASPSSMRPFISRSDPYGQQLWSKYYIVPGTDQARVYGMDILDEDTSITIVYTGDVAQYSSNYQVGMIHTDSMGNFSWGKNYHITDFYTEFVFSVLKMSYGYAMIGYGSGGGNDLFVLALDDQGDLIWAKGFGSGSSLESLLYTNSHNAGAINGDVVFTGKNGTGTDADILLVRVDQNGNIDCGESHDLTVVTSDLAPFQGILAPTALVDSVPYVAGTVSVSTLVGGVCANPGPFLGNDTSSCSTIVLSAASLGNGTTFQWQDGSTGPTYSTDTPGTYWVQATQNCCSASDTIIISPGTLPAAAFTPSPDPCSLSITTANTSSGASSYQWDFGDGQTSSAVQPAHTYASAGAYTVALTATNGCGSGDTTMQVVFSPLGTFGIAGPDTLCANVPGTYTSSLTNAASAGILWSSGESTPSITWSSPVGAFLFATATDTNACTYSDSLLIHIDPVPVAGFSFNALACDSLVTFFDASADAADWAWSLGNGETSTASSPTGQYDYGTFTITQVVANACGSDTAVQSMTLGPTDTAVLSGPSTLCQGEGGTYSVDLLNGTAMANVAWSASGSDSSSTFLVLNNGGNLAVTVTGADGCTYQDTLLVQSLPPPDASFTFNTSPCDSNVAFINTSMNADAYLWNFGNGETSDEAAPTAVFLNNDTFSVTLVALNGCGADSMQQPLIMGTVPMFQMTGPGVICSDAPITLGVAYSGSDLQEIHWSTGDSTATVTFVPEEGQVVSVIATNAQGCLLTATDTLNFSGYDGASDAFIPNVFTPNHDGINEVFAPVIQSGFISMSIFNRWGQELYQSSGTNTAWHGDYKGSAVPDGTYIYLVKWKDQCTGNDRKHIGHITVLR